MFVSERPRDTSFYPISTHVPNSRLMRLVIILTIACATPLAAQAKPDTTIVHVYSAHRADADSVTVHRMAVKQSPQPANAKVVALGILGDTAKVTVYTTMGDAMLTQQLRYVRRAGTWTQLPDPWTKEAR